MSASSSGFILSTKDLINGYEIIKPFSPGGSTFTAIAISKKTNRKVFFKKYKNPTGFVKWYKSYVDYQKKLKETIENHIIAKNLVYEMIEFFEVVDPSNSKIRAYYQVFEFVENGFDLKKVISSIQSGENKFDWEQRLLFAKVMMGGINAIHDAGIIHTDLKPENLYLVPDSSIAAKYKLRIIDLDNSLIEGEQAPWHDERVSDKESYMGTDYYYSPEHLKLKVPNKKSDVFTCGMILSELLGGKHPCQSGDYNKIAVGKIGSGSFEKIPIENDIPNVNKVDLENLIYSCFNIDDSKRPTAKELQKALAGNSTSTPLIKEDPLKVSPFTVTLKTNKTTINEGENFIIDITLGDDSSNFKQNHIRVSNASIIAFSGTGRNFKAEIVGKNNGSNVVEIIIDSNQFKNDKGADNLGHSLSINVLKLPTISKESVISFIGENGVKIEFSSSFVIGKNHFSKFESDFSRFYSDKQFTLIKTEDG